MKAQLRNQVAALFLLAPAAITLTALPSAALAQSAVPQVRSLEVTSDDGLSPGSRLRFTLRGSSNADASVHVRGVPGQIALREVERGLYVGRYVIAPGDRIQEGNPIRVTLRRDDRTVLAHYTVPYDIENAALVPSQQPRIAVFHAVPVDRLVAGTELRFRVEGAPGASGTIALPGVAERVRMREVRPGQYEGSYTIRRTDNVNVSGPIVASLQMGNRIASASLAEPLVASTRVVPGPIASGDFRDRGRGGYAAPGPAHVPVQIFSPPNDARVEGGALVRGRTAPLAAIEVGVQAVPGPNGGVQKIWEQVVRADANGNFEFTFSAPSPTVPGTRYDVSMTARTPDAMSETRFVLHERR